MSVLTARRRCLPALLAICLWPLSASAALTVQGVQPTDVAPSGFAVVWRASGPASPEIAVYADAAGTQEITRALETIALPLQGGDAAAADEVQRQAARERIQGAARTLGLQKLAVQGCAPGTTYYFRVLSRGPGGETATWPASGLASVRTARENAFVVDGRQILVSITDQGAPVDATGWVVTAAHAEGLAPVSAIAGDGCAANQAAVSVARIFATGGDGWLPSGTKAIDVEIAGPAGRTVRQSVPVDFAAALRVAAVVALDVALDRANAPPVAADQTLGTNEDTPLPILLTATDPESDPLTFAVASGPTHGVLSGTAPDLTYTPAANYSGQDSFTFTANDGFASSLAATVSITMQPVNDAPAGVPQVVVTDEDAAVGITLAATDVDGVVTSYAVASGPAHGVLSGTPPNLTYMPAANFNGQDGFTFTAGDGEATSLPAAVSIAVQPVPDAPVLAPVGSRTVAEGAALQIQLAANDVDGDPLGFDATGVPAGSTFDAVSGTFVWVPSYSQAGSYAVTFTVSDGSLVDQETVAITVTDANRPPVLAPIGNRELPEATTLSFGVSATDPDGDGVDLSVLGLPAGAAFNRTTGEFTWRPRLNQAGIHVVTFGATDSGAPARTTSQEVTITVTQLGRPFFIDNFADGASPGDWGVISGSWSDIKGSYTAGSLQKRSLARVLPLDPVSYPLTAGVVQVKMKLVTTPGGAAANGMVVFGYQAATRYRWVKVTAGGISIGQTGTMGGVAGGTKKKIPLNQPVGAFQLFKVKIFPDGWVRVYRGTAVAPVLSYRFLAAGKPSVAAGGVGLAALKARTVFDDVVVREDSGL